MDFLKNHHNRHHSSATTNRSYSDADSQLDEFHSPLRANSPHLSDSIITVNHTPFRSPLSNNVAPLAKSKSPAGNFNRSVTEDVVIAGAGNRKWAMVEKVGLGFRVCEVVFSLIAFSVMVSDKTQGWSGDSFNRYKEYRYLVAVNVIAFAYALFQAIDLTYLLVYERHIVIYSLRSHFDFLIDQILAYLLISSSSSAATRIDDWVLNWGSDEFTKMASASIAISFLAFLGFAFSSLISAESSALKLLMTGQSLLNGDGGLSLKKWFFGQMLFKRELHGDNGGYLLALDAGLRTRVWHNIGGTELASDKWIFHFLVPLLSKLTMVRIPVFGKIFGFEECLRVPFLKEGWVLYNGTWSGCWDWISNPRGKVLSELEFVLDFINGLNPFKLHVSWLEVGSIILIKFMPEYLAIPLVPKKVEDLH